MSELAAYKEWLIGLKNQIRQCQIKATLSVNSEMIRLYWSLGEQIVEKQANAQWGSGFLNKLSSDLICEFPTIKGFGKRNLEIIRQWFLFYEPFAKQAASQLETPKESIAKQAISQLQHTHNLQYRYNIEGYFLAIPWGHHILIIQKIKNTHEALFYIQKTVENSFIDDIPPDAKRRRLHPMVAPTKTYSTSCRAFQSIFL